VYQKTYYSVNGTSDIDTVFSLFQQSVLQTLLYLYEHKEIVIILVSKRGSPHFIEKLEALFCETVYSTS